MKLNPMTTSTLPQTSEYGQALQFSTGEVKHGVIYLGADPGNCFAVKPNPPTPEAVAKAQFVDKTYVWKEAATKAQPS